jgi:hypothetical protein
MMSSDLLHRGRAAARALLAISALLTFFERAADAYCEARSCDPDAKGGQECDLDPETRCSTDGIALRRENGCIDIAVKHGDAETMLGLSDTEFEQIVLEAFEEWSSVDCGNGHPSIQVQSVGSVETREPFSCIAMPSLNLNVWMLSDKIGDSVVTSQSGATAGITHPSFVKSTGEIFDADVELNALWLLVQDPKVLRDHLRIVATHEAGHVLGLAHSRHEDALMYRNYAVSDERKPTADDVKGICDLYPPGRLECARPRAETAALSQNACNEAYLADRANDEQEISTESSGCALSKSAPISGTGERISLLVLGLLIARHRR